MRALVLLLGLGVAACDGGGSPPADLGPADQLADTLAPDGLALRLDGPVPDGRNPCTAARQAVQQEMARINHCVMDGDCSYIAGQCPFGCHIPYNRSESTATLKQLLADYAAMSECPHCSYDCQVPGPVSCQAGRCSISYL